MAVTGGPALPAVSIRNRFRGYLPVVVDVETGGFNPRTDALLEIAAVMVVRDSQRRWCPGQTHSCHVEPFEGANIEPASLEFTGIDPGHPLRFAVTEREALDRIFQPVRAAVKEQSCTRALLVGHNAAFDLAFVNAAAERAGIKRNPFHPFSTLDTVSFAALAFGQTVLSRAVEASGVEWDDGDAHSAVYDAEQTAALFCRVLNMWDERASAA